MVRYEYWWNNKIINTYTCLNCSVSNIWFLSSHQSEGFHVLMHEFVTCKGDGCWEKVTCGSFHMLQASSHFIWDILFLWHEVAWGNMRKWHEVARGGMRKKRTKNKMSRGMCTRGCLPGLMLPLMSVKYVTCDSHVTIIFVYR